MNESFVKKNTCISRGFISRIKAFQKFREFGQNLRKVFLVKIKEIMIYKKIDFQKKFLLTRRAKAIRNLYI